MSKVGLHPIDITHAAATRDRILDTAERLLAEHGVAATSVRMITDGAGVNVAAVNYHFGSKENLVKAVIGRRFEELEAARTKALDAMETNAAREGRAPTTLELVEALLGPVFVQAFSTDNGWEHFIRFISRLAWDPGAEQLDPPENTVRMFEHFDRAFRRAMPSLDKGRRLWRLAFMRGTSQHTLLMIAAIRAGRVPKGAMLAGLDESMDVETIKRDLFAFVAAGLAA